MEDTTYRWPPQNNDGSKKPMPNFKKMGTTIIIAVLAIAIGMAAMTCFYTVDDKQQAVVTTFGKVTDVTDAGVHFKMPWQETVIMDNRNQKASIDLSCFSSDIQEVSVRYTVNYHAEDEHPHACARVAKSEQSEAQHPPQHGDYHHALNTETLEGEGD